MSDRESSTQDKAPSLGVFGRQKPGMASADVIAILLSVFWLLSVVVYFIVLRPESGEPGTLEFVVAILAIFLPIALIWMGATVAKMARAMREESQHLQVAIDGMRQAMIGQAQTSGMGIKPAVEKKLDEITKLQRRTEQAVSALRSGPTSSLPTLVATPVADAPKPASDQPSLDLDTPELQQQPELSAGEFIGALDFPENEDDREGFQMLRRALAFPNTSRLIQASQDLLTLLSQDGIYMDDLQPDRARPELWRRFANGDRGRELAGLGGIHDRASLALTSGRMRSDPIFRDAAHHFLREFDRVFAEFEKTASDAEIIKLADTRSARAFILLGRVMGTFA